MYSRNLAAGGSQIFLIGRIKHRDIVVQDADILLLEHLTVFTQNGISILIILTILAHFIHKKERQCLDALLEQALPSLQQGVSSNIGGGSSNDRGWNDDDKKLKKNERMTSPLVKVTVPWMGLITDTEKPRYCSICCER